MGSVIQTVIVVIVVRTRGGAEFVYDHDDLVVQLLEYSSALHDYTELKRGLTSRKKMDWSSRSCSARVLAFSIPSTLVAPAPILLLAHYHSNVPARSTPMMDSTRYSKLALCQIT